MSWNNLSMADRAAYIKLGLDSGITDLRVIRSVYNKYDEGGTIEQQLREQYPHYTDAQIQQLVRSRQVSDKFANIKNATPSPSKDYSRDIQLVQQALQDQANSLRDIDIKKASIKQEEEAKDKWATYKTGINAGITAGELLAGTYFLTKGALKGINMGARKLSRATNRYGMPVYNTSSTAGKVREATDKLLNQMDKGQTAMSSVGFGADIAQLMQGDTSWINNAELVGDAAGIIGGTNIVRNTPWFGRYRKGIDTTLDLIGYGAAGYDVGHYLFGE